MECEEFFLPDWSPPDDPAQALPAEGQHVPSDDDDDDAPDSRKEHNINETLSLKNHFSQVMASLRGFASARWV